MLRLAAKSGQAFPRRLRAGQFTHLTYGRPRADAVSRFPASRRGSPGAATLRGLPGAPQLAGGPSAPGEQDCSEEIRGR